MKLKRLLSLSLIIAAIFCFVSCKTFEPDTVTAEQSFSCVVSLNYNGLDIEADVVHHAPGLCTVSLTQPEALSGMTAKWEGGIITVNYLGMSMELSTDSFPQAAFLPAVLDVMDRLSTAGELFLETDETGERCIYTGQCSAGSFTAMLDNETGALYRIEIPDYGLDIMVTQFQSLSDSAE